MNFHLVRHGETDWNVQRRIQGQLDTELNANGREQALERGQALANLDFSAVYCSSSVRTQQTAEHILTGRNHHDVVLRDNLREINLGVWQGCYWADIEREQPEDAEAHRTGSEEFRIEGAETYRELQVRGVDAINSIVTTHADGSADEHVLVVSHGALLKSIVAWFSGVPIGEISGYPSLPNCAHSILVADSAGMRFETFAGEPISNTAWSATDPGT